MLFLPYGKFNYPKSTTEKSLGKITKAKPKGEAKKGQPLESD
jgi:hypothetical protein